MSKTNPPTISLLYIELIDLLREAHEKFTAYPEWDERAGLVLRRFDEAPAALKAQAGKPVAYLDIGSGGYIDVGSDLSDDDLLKVGAGKHKLYLHHTTEPAWTDENATAQIAELKALNARLLAEYEQRIEQIEALKAQAGEPFCYMSENYEVGLFAGPPEPGSEWDDMFPVYRTHPTTERRVPDDWKLMPIEPTVEMREAMRHGTGMSFSDTKRCYAAMINAAPAPKGEVE